MKKKQVMMMVFLVLNSTLLFAFKDSLASENKSKFKRIYSGFAIGGGLHGFTVGTSFGFIKQNNWGINGNATVNFYRSKNPLDFENSPNTWNLFLPEDLFTNTSAIFSVLLVREFKTNLKKIRLEMAAGPSLILSSIYNYKQVTDENGAISYFDTGSYDVHAKGRANMGITAKSSIGFMPTKGFCVQLAAFANFNTAHSYAGLQIEVLFGLLRDWTKRKKIKDNM